MKNEIPVEIKGIVPTPSGSAVMLGNDEKVIAIFVDQSVGAAIVMFMHEVKKPRPLTHDLIGHIFAGLDVEAKKVLVSDLKDETFYARLYLEQLNEIGTNLLEIDARPSDSIAIALQQDCPIFISEHVWSKAENMKWALDEKGSEDDGLTGLA